MYRETLPRQATLEAWNIGDLKLHSRLILAPMAGVTDLPFRMLNRKFGCELAFVEMLNVRSVSYKSKKTFQMLSSNPQDRPLGVQILGSEAQFILRSLDVLKSYQFDILDFNAACPVKKVVRRGEGAGLLRSPQQLHALLKIIVKESTVPVTVKLRTGWDSDSKNLEETASASQDAGVSAVFIHGRTRTQGYGGAVDYQAIAKVKKVLKIPVIASGDILSAQLAGKMLSETGCDGLLIARGALGNPWIFREIKESLEIGETVQRPDRQEITRTMIEHLNLYVEFYGERNGVVIFRKFFSWYTKGFRRIRPLREKSSLAKTRADMLRIIDLTLTTS